MTAACTPRALRLGAIALTLAAGANSIEAADPSETPTNVIAIQIRKQGYKCDSPQSAKRETSTGNPDDKVWVLDCEDASYRVHLMPDMAARVERLP